MMVGIELRGDGARLGHKVAMEMRKHGVILRPLGNTIVVVGVAGIRQGDLWNSIRNFFDNK